MTKKRLQFLSILLLLAMLLTACSGQITIEPSATVAPTSTETPLPSPTFTPTFIPTTTPTLPPTETPIPQPASLSGAVFLSTDTSKSFISLVELRQKDSFTLMGKSETDSSGVFRIENIEPGMYDLWVLITSKAGMVSWCSDVAPPDNKWKLGIKFGEDKGLTMENAYLSKGLMLAENLQGSDLKAQGFFAVLEDFKIESGIENKIDVILLCQ